MWNCKLYLYVSEPLFGANSESTIAFLRIFVSHVEGSLRVTKQELLCACLPGATHLHSINSSSIYIGCSQCEYAPFGKKMLEVMKNCYLCSHRYAENSTEL